MYFMTAGDWWTTSAHAWNAGADWTVVLGAMRGHSRVFRLVVYLVHFHLHIAAVQEWAC